MKMGAGCAHAGEGAVEVAATQIWQVWDSSALEW